MTGNEKSYLELTAEDKNRYLSLKDLTQKIRFEFSGNFANDFNWMLTHVNDELVPNFDSPVTQCQQFMIQRTFTPLEPQHPYRGGFYEFILTPIPEGIVKKRYYRLVFHFGSKWMTDVDKKPDFVINIKYVK